MTTEPRLRLKSNGVPGPGQYLHEEEYSPKVVENPVRQKSEITYRNHKLLRQKLENMIGYNDSVKEEPEIQDLKPPPPQKPQTKIVKKPAFLKEIQEVNNLQTLINGENIEIEKQDIINPPFEFYSEIGKEGPKYTFTQEKRVLKLGQSSKMKIPPLGLYNVNPKWDKKSFNKKFK